MKNYIDTKVEEYFKGLIVISDPQATLQSLLSHLEANK